MQAGDGSDPPAGVDEVSLSHPRDTEDTEDRRTLRFKLEKRKGIFLRVLRVLRGERTRWHML